MAELARKRSFVKGDIMVWWNQRQAPTLARYKDRVSVSHVSAGVRIPPSPNYDLVLTIEMSELYELPSDATVDNPLGSATLPGAAVGISTPVAQEGCHCAIPSCRDFNPFWPAQDEGRYICRSCREYLESRGGLPEGALVCSLLRLKKL